MAKIVEAGALTTEYIAAVFAVGLMLVAFAVAVGMIFYEEYKRVKRNN